VLIKNSKKNYFY